MRTSMKLLALWSSLLAAIASAACEDSGGGPDPLFGDDPVWTGNVYLEETVEWNPGPAGVAQTGLGGLIDLDGMPIQNDRALGPPLGTGSLTRGVDCTAVGIDGSAAWRFETGFYIFDGPGDDFITFEGSFAWGGRTDGLCCELAHVQVSEDGERWYANSDEAYDVNPNPHENNDGYRWANVRGLHGNAPTWANATQDVQAQEVVDGRWVDIPGVVVPCDFGPTDPHLGGSRFDLSTFRSTEDSSPWPAGGRMRYLRIIDDQRILDGQDWNKDWCLGAQMQAALGVHVRRERE